jgi:hypothetical protein
VQLRLAFAAAIFLGSYLPLSIILLAQNFDYVRVGQPVCIDVWTTACEVPLKNPWFSAIALAVCALGLIITFVALHIVRPKQRIEIVSSKYVAADLMNYVLPYVVSFMGLNYSEPDKVVGFVVFLMWIFLITYKSGQIIMNPVLSVFGWRLYEVEYRYVGGHDRNHGGLCLSQVPPEAGEAHRHAAIQDVLIIKKVSDAPSA